MRDLQYAIEVHQCAWPAQVQALFHQALSLGKQRHTLSAAVYQQQVLTIERHLDSLLKNYPRHEDSQRLWHRYHKHRRALFVFLRREDVPPTNHASEQALRNSVIYRKVTGGLLIGALNSMPISSLFWKPPDGKVGRSSILFP